jgi:Lon protease-like protein
MEVEIQVPDDVPVMTLPNLPFFPQALLPLHIFEPRYRRMLADVLGSNRIFAVACLDESADAPRDEVEPPHRVACIGLVRACQKNSNGTSNLLLQGLCRVAIDSILGDEPYRRIRIRALASEPGAEPGENARLRQELSRVIKLKLKLSPGSAAGMTELLKSIEDPEVFADIAAFNLCDDASFKQKLLETLDVNRRLLLLLRVLRSEVSAAMLHKKLQGGLGDEEISRN